MVHLADHTHSEIEWALANTRPSLGNAFGRLRSPDATFAELAALDAPELAVNSAVQTVESCCTRQKPWDRRMLLIQLI